MKKKTRFLIRTDRLVFPFTSTCSFLILYYSYQQWKLSLASFSFLHVFFFHSLLPFPVTSPLPLLLFPKVHERFTFWANPNNVSLESDAVPTFQSKRNWLPLDQSSSFTTTSKISKLYRSWRVICWHFIVAWKRRLEDDPRIPPEK